MRTPKAKKLKSGNWNIQIQINGKRYSCTAPTKREVQDKAKKLFAGIEKEKRSPLTVGKAIDKYIEEKTGTLSPSTIRGYKAVRRSYLQPIMDLYLSDLTSGDIQLAVSNDAIDGKSSKTIRNSYGLLTATLREFRPSFIPSVKLPQKKPSEIRIFTEEEMAAVWKQAKGTTYELPILLASWLGLRMSEIRGLKFKDVEVDDNGDLRIHICRAVVKGEYGDIEKTTKTISGNRWIKLPIEIHVLIRDQYCDERQSLEDYICPQPALTIYKNFIKICKQAGVEPCRFHDLRHFAASESHSLGIPDKYSMKRMGHATDNMLKTVYQHTIKKYEDEYANKIDERMREIYNKENSKWK